MCKDKLTRLALCSLYSSSATGILKHNKEEILVVNSFKRSHVTTSGPFFSVANLTESVRN